MGMIYCAKKSAILGWLSQTRLSCPLLHIKLLFVEGLGHNPHNSIKNVQLSVAYQKQTTTLNTALSYFHLRFFLYSSNFIEYFL